MKNEIERGYDLTSADQAQATVDSLSRNPVELQLLDAFVTKFTVNSGVICDLGCGPGQIARYFHDRGFQTVGVDLSAGILSEARKFHPEIRFFKANMKKLPFKTGELAAIVGFFSLCHIPRWEVSLVLTELYRTLRPSGSLLLAFHLGKGTFFRTESWGKTVSLQTTMFRSLELQDYLREAGFKVENSFERPPDETGGARGYLSAVKPGDDTFSLHEEVLTGSVRDVKESLAQELPLDTMLDGCTALHLAAGDGRLQVVKLLLRAGAEVDIACLGGGETALCVAVQVGQFATVRRLLEAGAEPNITDSVGNTPLHMACFNGRTDIVNFLLRHGADPSRKNKQGETPANWATRAGFVELAATLETAGPTSLKFDRAPDGGPQC